MKWPKPAKEVHSPYYAAIAEDACTGCGLCVSVCKNGALTMMLKDVLPDVPENSTMMNIKMAQERAKLNV